MKWVKTAGSWIKGAASFASGGFSSLYFYGALIAVGAGLVLWHGLAAEGARDLAFKAGQAQVRGEQALVENAALREYKREVARLMGITQHWSLQNETDVAEIDALRRAAVDDAERLRKLTNARRAVVASASDVAALRSYAATAGDVYEACRAEHRALGFDADECSAAAHTLKGWADEVTTPAPAQPLGGLGAMFTTPLVKPSEK